MVRGLALYSTLEERVQVVGKLYLRVREARRMTRLSQEALAGELAVSRGALAQWEIPGGTHPTVENLIALARRSGMAFEYLTTGRGPKVQGEPILIDESEDYRSLSSQQKTLLLAFEALTPRQRNGLLDLISLTRTAS